MKRLTVLTILASLTVLGAQAQDAPAVKAKIKSVKAGQIDTPQFAANNIGEKRWKPKAWLEVDVEFEIAIPRERKGSLDAMVVNIFVAFNHKKENKTEFIKGTFNCVDIPSNETSHLLAYLPPATLRRVFEKDTFTATSDIQGWGVEIVIDGKVIAAESSIPNTKWWEKAEALELVEGTLLGKRDTPFGILWGDYDVTVKKP
jgi:hypothetical protein